jgi:hypothetical protein
VLHQKDRVLIKALETLDNDELMLTLSVPEIL